MVQEGGARMVLVVQEEATWYEVVVVVFCSRSKSKRNAVHRILQQPLLLVDNAQCPLSMNIMVGRISWYMVEENPYVSLSRNPEVWFEIIFRDEDRRSQTSKPKPPYLFFFHSLHSS
mmetsp:Transcript_2748/g.5957  ORF Transcript_2748/g.5957 Transcript_2748/m.5957 type:complete len:117 (+) Transcript_2748:1-351(+)